MDSAPRGVYLWRCGERVWQWRSSEAVASVRPRAKRWGEGAETWPGSFFGGAKVNCEVSVETGLELRWDVWVRFSLINFFFSFLFCLFFF